MKNRTAQQPPRADIRERRHDLVVERIAKDQHKRQPSSSVRETPERETGDLGYGPQAGPWNVVLIAVGLALAVALRASLLDFQSGDYLQHTGRWYETLKTEGFGAFGRDFSNYNLPYLYLLYVVVRSLPDVPPVIAVKLPSLAGDFASAWLVFHIVRLKYRGDVIPLLAAFTVLFAPTLVLNSAFWGQADAIYASALLAVVYLLARGRDGAAMAMYGLSVALKAQSIFLLPLLAGLVMRGLIRWRSLLWLPLLMFATIVPGLAAGRPLLELLTIYPSQANQYAQLTMHAPSIFAWIPDTGQTYVNFLPVGLFLTTGVALLFSWAVYKSRRTVDISLLLELALLSVILMPYFLPKMHERYFYLADLFSIVFVFFVPSYFLVPIIMIATSFFAYQPALFGVEPIPMRWLAVGIFVLIVALLQHAVPRLFPAGHAH